MPTSVIADLRTDYHRKLCAEILGYRPGTRSLSIADGSSKTSVRLAALLVEEIAQPLCAEPPSPQTAGTRFTELTTDFLKEAFARIQHLRPGRWRFSADQSRVAIGEFDQYEHLVRLHEMIKTSPDLAAALGGNYLIAPDIIVAREPATDAELNQGEALVSAGDSAARRTPLRAANAPRPHTILHACVSCKWTMRSDRAQNIRTEALSLMRHRKGRTPHIVAVTLEPLPTRLASIALGTGDLDCAYHAALDELLAATEKSGNADQMESLRELVDGRRLRDISDLPFDLAT